MKHRKNTLSGFFSRAMNLITSLALAVALCFSAGAWLTRNRRTDASPVLLDLKADDAIASYSVYKYDLINECGVDKDGEGNPLTISNIEFNQYDLIFKLRNRYTPVLAHVVITKLESTPVDGKLQVTFSRNPTPELTGDVTADIVEGGPLPYISSSVLRVTAEVDKEGELTKELYGSSAEDFDLYTYVDRLMYDESLENTGTDRHNEGDAKEGGGTYDYATGTFFTKIEEAGTATENEREIIKYSYTREDEFTFTVNYSEADWDAAWTEGEEVLHVYLYLTYDTELIDCVQKERNMNEISIGKNMIDFQNDLQLLSIKCIGEESGD